ncbi:hypothetical protein F5J12DRAFT_783004 [Pisolithus orientalis]|uniref:uncharacterized protein n=1 Tax=Pisolithus orientalis TaxID=936130 RepID=UPI0022256F6A|nr:uncharacterized protein F5J12DRAFT_783004 [Pisolithus orientalis]KAI6006225.1 hypothetical protein F5J12DRAFT_783004 [Pisolithus orientalis]
MGLVPLTAPEGLEPSRVVLVSIWDCVYQTASTLLSSVTALRGLNDSFSVYPEETHFLGHADGILPFWILIGIPPICFHFNSVFLIHYSNIIFCSWQSTLKDMIGKLKLWHTVQPPEGWEEHMFGLRDRRYSLTPCPSIVNTPMLPSPSLHLDDQICDEDSAMEVEENPNNNENEDDQPSSNENKDDQPSGSKKEDDWLPSSNDDDKGSDYNENENDDEETESLGDSCDDDDAHTCNAQTVSCAQSPLPPFSPPMYESDDSTHPVGDVVHPCQEGSLIYTRLQKKGKGRAIDAKDIDAANHSDHDTQLLNLKKPGNLTFKMMVEELGQWHGQSACNILVTVGFSVKASHTKINEANLFHSWYWAMQPKPDGGISKDAFAARREKLKAIYEWSESSSALEQTMQRHNFLDWSLMDKYAAIFKNGNGADARVAGTGSIGDSHVALKLAIPRKFPGTGFSSFVQKSHLTIVNWPHGVSPPGPGFEYKKLRAGPLHQLVVPYLWRKLGLLYDGQTDDEEEQDSLDDVLEKRSQMIQSGRSPSGKWIRQQQGMEVSNPHVEASNHDTIGPQDSQGDHMNYHDPGPSNIPYHHNQFPPSHQGFHHIPSRTNHPYYNGPYTDDYYPPTQSGEPHWVNRGNAAQYEDNFAEEYINEDYY